MEFEFGDDYLAEVWYNPKASLRHGPAVDNGFRKVIGNIQVATDERALRALQGMHYHKLGGNRSHQHALSINKQWRVIVERIKDNRRIRLLIVAVEDYH